MTKSSNEEFGKKTFFPRKESCGQLKVTSEYFLADAQGSKLSCEIKGRSWSLNDYLHVHGYYPSKTKIFCVQVSYKLGYLLVNSFALPAGTP